MKQPLPTVIIEFAPEGMKMQIAGPPVAATALWMAGQALIRQANKVMDLQEMSQVAEQQEVAAIAEAVRHDPSGVRGSGKVLQMPRSRSVSGS